MMITVKEEWGGDWIQFGCAACPRRTRLVFTTSSDSGWKRVSAHDALAGWGVETKKLPMRFALDQDICPSCRWICRLTSPGLRSDCAPSMMVCDEALS